MKWDSLNAFSRLIEKFKDNTRTPIHHVRGVPFAGTPTITSDYVRFFATSFSQIHKSPRPEIEEAFFVVFVSFRRKGGELCCHRELRNGV